MSKRLLWAGGAALVSTLTVMYAAQRGPGGPGAPGGPGGRNGRGGFSLASYYTNKSTPLSAADASAADQACRSSQGHARLVCLADLLLKDKELDAVLIARLRLPYSVGDAASHWSNFPPMVYRDRVGVTLGELSDRPAGNRQGAPEDRRRRCGQRRL